MDPAPLASTEPKRRSLGAVALRDRGRKLYPDPGAGTGTSKAEADPSSSRVSMDWFDRTVIYNNLSLINFYGEVFYYYYCQGDE